MGPIARVDTLTAGINLDVNRLLRMGSKKTLVFKVPDSTQITNWRIVYTINKYWDRISGGERTAADGSEVIFKVADPTEALGPVLVKKDLYVEVEDQLYSVARVPPVASNEAQVFTLTCKVRTLRNKFFDNSK